MKTLCVVFLWACFSNNPQQCLPRLCVHFGGGQTFKTGCDDITSSQDSDAKKMINCQIQTEFVRHPDVCPGEPDVCVDTAFKCWVITVF